MDEEELVTIYTTDLQWQVTLIKLRLDEADIEYMTSNETFSGLWGIGVPSEVRFLVGSKDAERAAKVLREHGFK
jgi:hypothetical protein